MLTFSSVDPFNSVPFTGFQENFASGLNCAIWNKHIGIITLFLKDDRAKDNITPKIINDIKKLLN